MLRKNKVRLAAMLIFPSLLFLSIVIALWFERPLFWTIQILSVFFLIFVSIFIFLPRASNIIGGEKAKPVRPFLMWMIFIFLIELGFIALYLLQNYIVLNNPLLPNLGIDILSKTQQWQAIFAPLGFNLSGFPWTLLITIAIGFAVISIRHHSVLPFSEFVPNWKDKFITNELKRIVDLCIALGLRLFLLLNVLLLALQCGYWLMPKGVYYNYLLNSIIITSLFFLLFNAKNFQKSLSKMEKKSVAQGWHFVVMWVAIALMTALGIWMVAVFMSRWTSMMPVISALDFLPKASPKIVWQLWNWEWWILAMPLLASLLIKFSRGRTLRQFMIVAFLLPTILSSVFILFPQILMVNLWQSAWVAHALMVITTGFLIYLFSIRRSHRYLWLGYLPMVKIKKDRRLPFEALWALMVPVIGIILIIGLLGLQLLGIASAIGILIIGAFTCHSS